MSKRMKVALVIERCPRCPWYSEMRGCQHHEGPSGIVENDYIINPNCPLPDYVDVSKLQKELDALVKALNKIKDAWKCNDRGYSDYNQGYDDALISCSDIADEALAKINGGEK